MRNDVYYVPNALPLVYNKLVVLSEEQKIATYLVSKNANSTLYNKALQNKGYVTHFAVNQHMNIWWRYLPTCLLDKEKEDDYQKVVVIREPLDRIESAFHTIATDLNGMAAYIAAVAGIFASAGITKAWSEKYEK